MPSEIEIVITPNEVNETLENLSVLNLPFSIETNGATINADASDINAVR